MNLKEVFDQLSHGELSMISIGGTQEQGEINDQNYAKVLANVNLGLAALYKRFNLKEGVEMLTLEQDKTVYKLTIPDLLKIEKVQTEYGWLLPINLEGERFSVFTTDMRTLVVPRSIVNQESHVPNELKTETLRLLYRAKHPEVELGIGVTPSEVELELPYSHLEALLYFVASRMYTPIGMSNEGNMSNVWYAKYEGECQRLEAEGFEINQGFANDRLSRGGWV